MSEHILSEADYRRKVQETLDRVEKAFSEVDPDVAECEQAQGAMTITFQDRTRCILSAQPSVRQLWLALAAQGTAYHFNYRGNSGADSQPGGGEWIDDKGRGVELLSFLQRYLSEKTGVPFRF